MYTGTNDEHQYLQWDIPAVNILEIRNLRNYSGIIAGINLNRLKSKQYSIIELREFLGLLDIILPTD